MLFRSAIGTQLNAPAGYAAAACVELRKLTGMPLVVAEDMVEATQDAGVFVMVSGVVKRVAVKLSKTANDLRPVARDVHGHVQRLAFHDIYLVDKTASEKANHGNGNLAEGLRYVARERTTRAFVLLGWVLPLFIIPNFAALPPIYAKVVIREEATGLTFDLVTNASGEFVRPALKPGNYTVTHRVVDSHGAAVESHAPVVVSPKMRRSATLPPSSPAILSSNSVLDCR